MQQLFIYQLTIAVSVMNNKCLSLSNTRSAKSYSNFVCCSCLCTRKNVHYNCGYMHIYFHSVMKERVPILEMRQCIPDAVINGNKILSNDRSLLNDAYSNLFQIDSRSRRRLLHVDTQNLRSDNTGSHFFKHMKLSYSGARHQ